MNMTDKQIVQTIIDHGYLIVMNDQKAYEVSDETGILEPREALVDTLVTYLTSQVEHQPVDV